MNDMVERMVILLRKMILERQVSIKPEDNLNFHRAYEPIVYALLEVMREPTDGMFKAGMKTEYGNGSCRATWQAMIDAALNSRP